MAEPADCDEVLREIYTFLDGELTPEGRHAIEGHLNGCTDCLEVYDFEVELRMLVARKCSERVPERLRMRIQQALSEAGSQPADGQADAPS
jgi:mycothiol system anti-sigma-R factor